MVVGTPSKGMTTVKLLAAATLTLASIASSPAFSQQSSTMTRSTSVSSDEIRSVSPALGRYEKEDVVEGLWARPQLSVRDRSVVTVATLIARSQTADLPHYMSLALDNGVTPKELSEIISHLAFYAGWTNATSAVAVAHDIFAERNIGADQLPEASPDLMPLNQEVRLHVKRRSKAYWAMHRLGWQTSRRIRCSRMSGCDRISRRVTAVS